MAAVSTPPKLQFMPLRRPLRFADDEQLVAQVRAGRRDAFEVVYDRHHAGILSFCRHMLGSAEEAEDVVQQTFAAAYGSLLADEREIALKPWLYAIARNGCLSALRVQRDHLALEDGDARLPATVGLSVEVEQREDLRALLGDLQGLPEDQRAALILAELGAETHEEIALVLGVPAVKVRALIFQAREALMSRRVGRDGECGPIREQLSFLRGGARRRRELRHHIAQCAGCRAFEAETSRQRAGMAVLLPVAPTLALKQSSLAAAFGGSGAAAGGVTAGGVTSGGVTAGGVTAGGVTAGGVTAGSVGGTYSVVGGAVAGGSAAGGAAAGGVASIGGVAVLSGGGVLAGVKLLGLKALVGVALTGATASGYTAAQGPADDAPAPPAHANVSISNQPKKTAPKPPPAGVAVPIGLEECRKAGASASKCAVKASSDPVPAGAGATTGDRGDDAAPKGTDGDRDGDGVPNGQPRDRDGNGGPNGADRCPNRPGTSVDGCPVAPRAPIATVPKPRDRDGDGVPNGKDRCPNKPRPVDGCPLEPAAPAPLPTAAAPRDRDGDGVLNRDDKCPNKAGTINGCPAERGTPIPAVPAPLVP